MTKKLKINMISESEFSVKGHGVHTAYLELANALKKRSDTDVVVNHMRRSADITHIQTVGPYSLMHLLFGPGKKVVTAHVVPASFIGSLAGAKYWLPLAKLYLRFFYGRADKVFAVSGSVANVLIREMGIKVERVSIFYNTIDMAQYLTTEVDKAIARKTFGISDKTFLVVGNGQVQPRKRVDILASMAKKMPDVRFFWVGGIPFKRLGADAQAMQKLMDNVPRNMTVTGVIELKDVKRYYQAADVFVLPAMQE
ncbi:MAG: glycosyltransferase family 4 protein, partial [Microcoleus sp.]